MEVKLVKFVNGEECFAQVEQIGNDVVLTNAIILSVDQAGQPIFMPFPQFRAEDAKVVIAPDKILYIVELHEKMVARYKSAFGGIIEPPNKLII